MPFHPGGVGPEWFSGHSEGSVRSSTGVAALTWSLVYDP